MLPTIWHSSELAGQVGCLLLTEKTHLISFLRLKVTSIAWRKSLSSYNFTETARCKATSIQFLPSNLDSWNEIKKVVWVKIQHSASSARWENNWAVPSKFSSEKTGKYWKGSSIPKNRSSIHFIDFFGNCVKTKLHVESYFAFIQWPPTWNQ